MNAPMHMRYFPILILLLLPLVSRSQDSLQVEKFKEELLALRADVDNIQLNLNHSRKRFKRGIIVATIGYTVTITGGLMLGRKNDDLGKVLLITGGTIGGIGTVMLIDSFKFLGRPREQHPVY
jgi:hypothetical protein